MLNQISEFFVNSDNVMLSAVQCTVILLPFLSLAISCNLHEQFFMCVKFTHGQSTNPWRLVPRRKRASGEWGSLLRARQWMAREPSHGETASG